jgi:hypothetical protein
MLFRSINNIIYIRLEPQDKANFIEKESQELIFIPKKTKDLKGEIKVKKL